VKEADLTFVGIGRYYYLILLLVPILFSISSAFALEEACPDCVVEGATFVLKFGSQGTGDGQFDQPWGIDVDNSGNIYVAEYWNHRIQKFDSSGNHLLTIDTKGIFAYDCNPSSCGGDGQINQPHGLEVDSSGNVWVIEVGNHRAHLVFLFHHLVQQMTKLF